MIPTWSDFTEAFRFHMSDTQVAGGQVWTDASGKIQPYLQQAFSELYKGFEGAAVKNITRTLYGILPANSSYFSPTAFGAANFSEPTIKPLWERPADTAYVFISSITSSTGSFGPFTIVTASSPHGLAIGDQAMIFKVEGITDKINDIWTVAAVPSPTVFWIQGLSISGTVTNVGAGGAALAKASNSAWSEVLPLPEILEYPQTPGGSIRRYAWIDNGFRVLPATVDRQIKLIFYLSGQAPTSATPTASLGFDDCLGFLAYRAAALAHQDKGRTITFHQLNQQAYGADENPQTEGGLFGQLLRSKERSAARNPIVVGGFRDPRRNAGNVLRF
jgi:hypothetical protein